MTRLRDRLSRLEATVAPQDALTVLFYPQQSGDEEMARFRQGLEEARAGGARLIVGAAEQVPSDLPSGVRTMPYGAAYLAALKAAPPYRASPIDGHAPSVTPNEAARVYREIMGGYRMNPIRKRLQTLEDRSTGSNNPPPFLDIAFPDGGPGAEPCDIDPREEYRPKYGIEPPPPKFVIKFDNEKDTES
jgi:hypothetical protein